MSLGISAAAWLAIGTTAASAYGSYKSGQAAKDASQQQAGSAQAGIAEQRRQFDAIQKLLSPYVTAGTGALTGQQDLIGLNGNTAQSSAVAALQASPAFTSANKAGQDAILARASATGGLRGGNVEAALGQFSPQLLTQMINDQYTKLGGLTSIGQNAAAGVGNAGIATGNQVTQLLQQQGAALAGGDLAAGRTAVGYGNAFGAGLGAYYGAGGSFLTPQQQLQRPYSGPGGGGGGVTESFDTYNGGAFPDSGAFSDARLKKNIVPLGMTVRGNKVYRWDWKTGGSSFGVIAQEVEHIPGAVHADRDGLLKVDYSKV